MKMILLLALNIFVVGLFLYSKLLPYRDKLENQFKSAFDFFSRVFEPVLNFLKRFFTPFQVGQGIAVDMTQIVLLLILLFLINLI